MHLILSLLLAFVFISLSVVHFHWALGGTWGYEVALPTNNEGQKVLNPRKWDSAIVGLGLVAFALFYLLDSGIIAISRPEWTTTYIGWFIPAIFLLRAMGDFRYVGVFKKTKSTYFAKWDTQLFTPLCIGIAILGVMIKLM